MVKSRPSNERISEAEIIKALGRGFPDGAKNAFAIGLVEELEKVFAASEVAFPDKKIVDNLQGDLDQIILCLLTARRLAKKVEVMAEKTPHVRALLGVCSRAVAKKKYRADIADIFAFLEVAVKSTKHVRFTNVKRGPDIRLALEVSLIVARRYTKAFGKPPGIASTGTRGDGSANLTPYQRVCAVISETKKIKGIGEGTQKQSRKLLAENALSPWPFFKPDIDWLPEKDLN